MSEQNNFLDETVTGIEKIFTEDPIDEVELDAIKNYLTGFSTLADMPDYWKDVIRNSDTDNIRENVKEAFIQTVFNTYRMRYGITN